MTSIRLRRLDRTGMRSRLFEPLDWALLRAPLLAVTGHVADASEVSADPRVRAAVAVSSSDLFNALSRTQWNPADADPARARLERYVVRMATRATPFGLFAGVGLIGWGPSTALGIQPGRPRTRTRPDMDWLFGLVDHLEAEPTIRRELRLVTSSALFVRAGRVFLAAPPPDASGTLAPTLSVRATPVVRHVLALARRPIPYKQLTAAVVEVTRAPDERAGQLVDALWQNGILLTDLRPPLTDTAPLRHLRDRLATVPSAAVVARDLDELLAQLEAIDHEPLHALPRALPALRSKMETLHPVPRGAPGVQVDTALSLGQATLSAEVATEAVAAAELLLRVSPVPPDDPALARYRTAFLERYGTNRAVPLLELMDPELGLGPPDETDPGNGTGADEAVRRREGVLEQLALRADREGAAVVELDDDVISRLEIRHPGEHGVPPAPSSLDISLLVAAASAEAVDDGDFRLVVSPNAGGVPAGSITARFADLLGAGAVAALRRAARLEDERSPGAIWTELVYVPGEPRLANVAIRPAIRAHEIALGTMPGVSWDSVVTLADLCVCLRGGRFHVVWPARGAEVIVSQGHMLNLAYAPAAARFLLEVGSDGIDRMAPFNWGNVARLPRLPRVQRGRVVLSPATWRLAASGLAESSLDEFGDRLSGWRATHSVPRHVYLAEGDNRLLLDIGDPAGARMLRDELRRRGSERVVVLQEALPGPDEAWMDGPDGRHFAEVVVPLVRRGAPGEATFATGGAGAPVGAGDAVGGAGGPVSRSVDTACAERLRPPGSDWLYLKVYCPPAVHEELITGPVQALARLAIATGLCDRWFFVRYRDPEPHLRLRFQGRPHDLISQLLVRLTDWAGDLVRAGIAQRFSFDTYDRELERYGGGDGMALAEAVFGADSTAVAELLSVAPQPRADERLAVTIRGVDALLSDLGWAGTDRARWYEDHAQLSKGDGLTYRTRRDELRTLLGTAGAPSDPVARVLAARSEALRSLEPDLIAARGHDGPGPGWGDITASLVHMHCNRLLELDSPLESQALALLRRTRDSLTKAPV